MTESFDFSTSRFSPAERYDRFRDLYAYGADTQSIGPAFSADVKGWRLERLILFDRQLTGVGGERLAPRVRRDQFDHFTLQLNRRGEFHGEGADGFRAVRPGELLLMDMSRPMRTRMPDTHIVTVSVARELVEAAADSTDRLHGRVLPTTTSGLLGDFLVSLTQRAPTLSTPAMTSAAQVLVELLRIALGSEQSAAEPARAQLDVIRFENARRFIEAHLEREDLGPETVAAATNLSRATLYRMFEESGGVAKYIQARRLLKLRNALGDPGETRTFVALAHMLGFASESHASRAFHTLFGVRPTDFRHTTRQLAESNFGEEASTMKRKFVSWQAEVR